MTDLEFDVLDELYFVIAYQELQAETGLAHEVLHSCLIQLWEKGWIKCFLNASEEALPQEVNLQEKYQEYFYLASKEGLLAHNLG